MFRISGIIVNKLGRDYSGNMENTHGLKTERLIYSLGVIGKEVPSVGVFVEDLDMGVEYRDGEFVGAQVLPDVFHGVEFR